MAKEKFVRSKPHVNVGSWIKQKLGFGVADEPPIEPLDESGPTKSQFEPDEALGAGALKDTDGEGVPEVEDGGAEGVVFYPKELSVDKSVPWKTEGPPDPLGQTKVKFPATSDTPGGGANEPSLDDTLENAGAAQAGQVGPDSPELIGSRKSANQADPVEQETPSANAGLGPHDTAQAIDTERLSAQDGEDGVEADGPNPHHTFTRADGQTPPEPPEIEAEAAIGPEPDDEVLVDFEQGEPGKPLIVGSLWNGEDEAPDGLVKDTHSPSIQRDHSYQHNQTDLEFVPVAAADSDGSETDALGGGKGPSGDISEDAASQSQWSPSNFQVSIDGLETETKPGLSAPDDESSSLVPLEETRDLTRLQSNPVMGADFEGEVDGLSDQDEDAL